MSSYLQRHMRTHAVNTGGDPEMVTQTPVGIQNGQVAPTTQKVHIMSDMPATLNLELCNQTSSLNPQTFFLVQVPNQNTPKLILLPSHQILNSQQKVPTTNANLVTIPNNTCQKDQPSKVSRKRTRQRTSNAVSNITAPSKNILIMPNTSQALPSMQPLQFQTIQSFPRAQTLPMGQNFIVLQNMAEQSPLQLPTMQINTMPPSQKATNIQIQQVSNTQDVTIQSLPSSQEVSNIQVKTVPPSDEMSNIQTLSNPQNISNVHVHQELPNVQLQTGPTTTHLSDIHIQALQETQSLSGLQESRNLIVVQNSPGEELVSTSESVESLQSMEEVQDVHFETLQTEDGLQNVLVLQNADGEQTRLCVQGVENIQGIQDVSNVQIQAMSNMQENANSAPECQKVFIFQSAQGEQTLQVVDNFQADQNVHVVENIQGLQAGQNQLQVGQNQLQVLPGLQLPQNMQLRTVPSSQGLQAVQNVQGLQNIQTVNSGGQNIQTIQLVQKNSVQGLQHVLPFIQIVQSAPKVQLVHTF